MKIIIREGEAGILFKKGKIENKLGPGKYRYYPRLLSTEIEVFDLRTNGLTYIEDFVTKDKVTFRGSGTLFYSINDPIKYAKSFINPQEYIRGLLVDVYRTLIGKNTIEKLLEDPESIQKDAAIKIEKGLKEKGLTLDKLTLPSIIMPKNLKAAFEAELAAKKKSLAELEEARGRTAVLRHLANSAKLVEDRPEIMKLFVSQKAKNVQIDFSEVKKNSD